MNHALHLHFLRLWLQSRYLKYRTMIKKSIYFIFLFFCVSCAQTHRSLNDRNCDVLDINPEAAREYKTSELFDSLRYIVLEDKENSLISDIGKIELYDSVFYISDVKAKKILCFNREGKFLQAIGKIGQGPGEYVQLSDFTFDYKNRELLLLDRSTRRILCYSLAGECQRMIPIEMMGCKLTVNKHGCWLYTKGADFLTKKKGLFDSNLFLVNNERQIKPFFEYTPVNNQVVLDHVFDSCEEDSSVLFNYSICDTIYSLADTPQGKWYIDFGKCQLPSDQLDEKNITSFLNQSGFARLMNVRHSGAYLFVNYTFDNRVYFFIRNHETGELINCSYLQNDLDKISFALTYPEKVIRNECYFIKEATEILDCYKQDTLSLLSPTGLSVEITRSSNPVVVVGYLK